MPQLDVSTYLPQLVWLAIAFATLYALMAWLGLPPVGAVLEQRRAKIEGDLDKAQQIKSEAEAVMAAYERGLADARSSAQETLRRAMEQFHAEAEARQRETARTLQQETAAAEQRIAGARTAALADLRSVAADVAQFLAQKLAGAAVGGDAANAAVDSVLSERS